MNQDPRLPKIEILMQQEKFNEAGQLVKELLAEDAYNTYYLGLLAEIYLHQDKLSEAQTIIDNAIGISPDNANLFFTKSRIKIQQDDWQGADALIHQAINMDPLDSDFFAMLGHIQLARKEFEEALKSADKSLELNPENLLGLNTRSTALLKLNRKDDSFTTIEGALRNDPNNAFTHSNFGWSLLEKGNHRKALEHFREALKTDPGFEYAHSGMMEALKAKNILYRLFLRYSFWMSNLTAKYQWGVLIGFYVVFKILRNVARANENLQPFLIPVIILLALIAFSTWIINPISNLFLKLDPYGKYLLDDKEKKSSNFVGLSLLLCILGVILYFVTKDARYLPIAGFGFIMMVPLGVMYSPSKYNNSLLVYAIVMGVLGLISIFIAFTGGEIFNAFTLCFLAGFVLFQWIVNFLMIKEDNR